MKFDIGAIVGVHQPAGKIGALLHELFILLVFCAFTALLSWPYINYLRDAVVDPGDPYLVSWILWWDYHQTFTNPLHLFDANIFYPYRYTLAFTEHCYGIALLFFPLFALGCHPLTVHAVAIFVGFVSCGYGAFRLARTLTGSEAIAWVAGIVFAFVPFRFHLLSHLPYVFSPWIPLLFEALILFVRKRSGKSAAWLGCAFFMTGLTTISWFTLSLAPFAFSAAVLLTRHGLWRERDFWRRGAVALGLASIALLPFMLPYFLVSKLYGFKRTIEEVKANSAWPIHWLSVENRNKLWNGMGVNIPNGARFKLFPGLLPILFSLVAVTLPAPAEGRARPQRVDANVSHERWSTRLDIFIWVALAISILAVGFDRSEAFGGIFRHVTSERALAALAVAIIARLSFSYPPFLCGPHANLIETLRSERRGDAFWLGIILTIVGFCYSLGWNFFFYRICYDLLPMFRSMRVPTRGAMIAYLGIALLAGLGVERLARFVVERRPRVRRAAVFAVVCALLLFELNAAPLHFMRGDVFPDAVTLRLKETPMRGGVVVLPAGADFNHRHMLRAADHGRPLIVGTSGFNPPYEDQIELATRGGPIAAEFMDLLEKIPASYVVVENKLIAPERRVDYETFLERAVLAGRLRFINRFDGHDDLYAVVKTEPQASAEAPLPFASEAREWSALIKENPVNVLGQYRSWSQAVYRLYVASYGQMPGYREFLTDVESLGSGVMPGFSDERQKLEANLYELANEWVERAKFRARYKNAGNDSYVDALTHNAGITLDAAQRADLVDKLNSGTMTRAQVLLEIVNSRPFVEKEEVRSLVLLHYFGYLHRNPADAPDSNLDGFNYWVRELEASGDNSRLTRVFMASGEYQEREKKVSDKK